MPTRLLLVRHAASQHKEQGITGGPHSCRGLTELGRQQAACLRDRFIRNAELFAPTHIYASIVPRTIETASILAEAFDEEHREVRQDCGLCSWHIPAKCEGMPVKDFQQQFAVPGGGVFRPFEAENESWSELVGRTGRALWSFAQRHRGETILAVMHAETIKASLIAFGNLPLIHSFDALVANASLTEWTTEEDTLAWPSARWTLARFNDTAHLENR